jgi:hypothetical protein
MSGARTLALALGLSIAVAGCGGSHPTAPNPKIRRLPIGTPGNTAADSTVMRWAAAYVAGVESDYDSLLASDFHYIFSEQTDPVLSTQFGNTWGKVDERTAFHHELYGFTNSSGVYVPPFISAAGQVLNISVYADPTHPDSAAWYKLVTVLQLKFTLDVNADGGTTEYSIDAPFDFLIVRGDAAVLSPGQDHSATRWYIHECDDLSALIAGSKKLPSTESPMPSANSSWGRLRAQYL